MIATRFPARKLDGLRLPVGHCLLATAMTAITAMTAMMALVEVSVDPKMSSDAKNDQKGPNLLRIGTSREPC